MIRDPDCESARYDVSFPDVKYTGPIAGAPLPLKVWKVSVYLGAVTREAAAAMKAGAELPAILAGLAAVDYLAGFHSGRETKRADYETFLRTYFPARYGPYAEKIYLGLRCGLMHNLVVVNPWRGPADHPPFLITSGGPAHLEINGARIVFSISQFIVDIWCGWRRFSHAVLMLGATEPERAVLFERRFDRLAGAGAFMESVPDQPEGAAQQGVAPDEGAPARPPRPRR